MQRLSNLETLDLAGNQLDRFPENVCMATALKTLKLAKNRMKGFFPRDIARLTRLTSIEAANNYLNPHGNEGMQGWQALAALPRLRTLDLDHNQIAELLTDMGSSITPCRPYAEHNMIKQQPTLPVLAGMKALRVLKLNGNVLEEISAVIFTLLPRLEVLELLENRLKDFPWEAAVVSPFLRRLILNKMGMSRLSEGTLAALRAKDTYILHVTPEPHWGRPRGWK